MILEVSNLNKTFGNKQVLRNVNMSIGEKEIISFVGPNGAGKSTTLKCIANFILPDSGKIKICGYDLNKERQKALINLACQIESPGLFYNLTGYENIDFIKNLYQTPAHVIKIAMNFIDIGDKLNNKVSTFSTGMKKRLAIGLAIMLNHKLLILDEPTNGLDFNSVIKLRKLLKHLKDDMNMSVIFSSHNLSEIEKVSDRIIFIKDGEIINVDDIIKDYYYEIELNKNISKYLSNNNILFKQNTDNRYIISSLDSLNKFLRIAINNSCKILSIEKNYHSLETIYERIYQ